ncbi:MAG: hypothetical protein Q9219_003672 [cf. Caloplaca sp. 3 TL-2023]
MSVPTALAVVLVLTASLAIFLIPLPRACTVYAVPMVAGCFVYPISKRWTNFPQLVLAMVLPSGVFMGAAAVGEVPLPYPPHWTMLFDLRAWMTPPEWSRAAAVMATYYSCVVWTIFYEMVYSFQDAEWDEAAGIGTMTRLLKTQKAAKGFLALLAGFQTTLHGWVGAVTPMTSPFWPFSVVATLAMLIAEVWLVDLSQEESCMFWFAVGNMLTGAAMLAGYIGEYFVRMAE